MKTNEAGNPFPLEPVFKTILKTLAFCIEERAKERQKVLDKYRGKKIGFLFTKTLSTDEDVIDWCDKSDICTPHGGDWYLAEVYLQDYLNEIQNLAYYVEKLKNSGETVVKLTPSQFKKISRFFDIVSE